MPLPPQPTPPAFVVLAPDPGTAAEVALLEALDWGWPLPADPKLKGPRALDYRWLQAAAAFEPGRGLPVSPYAGGTGAREAQALHRLLRAPADLVPRQLQALRPARAGTALALWRWGQAQVRAGAFPPPLRRAWEDRLLTAGPDIVRGNALRHALCWALAEQDEARLSAIRVLAGQEATEVVQGFQRLFGLLGGPLPVLRLWTLPELDYRDVRLDQLGGSRVWIRPAEDGPLPALPAGTAWILPSAAGNGDEREARLTGGPLAEGEALAARFRAAGRGAYFAPSREAFQQVGLVWFPILLELDERGHLHSVRMGDAAPRQP